MKKIWKKPVCMKVSVAKITLSGSSTGTEQNTSQGDPKRNGG